MPSPGCGSSLQLDMKPIKNSNIPSGIKATRDVDEYIA
jgi:hypothetical protein